MSLLEQRPEGFRSVRFVQPDRIGLDDRELDASFLLAPDQVIEHWPPRQFEAIDDAALEAAVALRPQVLLLGTGDRQRFLSPKLQAGLLRRGIGVEVMDNAAAARTYNLLAAEGRRVVAAFLL